MVKSSSKKSSKNKNPVKRFFGYEYKKTKSGTRSLSLNLTPIFIVIVVIVAIFFIIKAFVSTSGSADYVVDTNAFFAPFEYYDSAEIKGVDIDIINRVAEKTGKKIDIKNVDFSVIIDNVASGKVADAGAAGITITDARAAKVDFTIPYYTSTQYVIYDPSRAPEITENSYITWEALAGKVIGTQTDTTGYLFTDGEISEGALAGTSTELKGFESAQLAADGISANLVDYTIVDELPAKYIVAKSSNLKCLPLYYSGTDGEPAAPAAESYAIAVNKNKPELLAAFNEVLQDLIDSGEINEIILKHMGL